MDISVVLAKFWGIYFLIFSLLILANKQFLARMFLYSKNERFLVLTGFIAFFIGLFHVVIHSVFEPDWRLMVTLMGYLFLIKGILRIAFPLKVIAAIQRVELISQYYLGGIVLIIGLLFLYFV